MPQKGTNITGINRHLSVIQMLFLVIHRTAIGWHFLYEGISKLYTPGWTSHTKLRSKK